MLLDDRARSADLASFIKTDRIRVNRLMISVWSTASSDTTLMKFSSWVELFWGVVLKDGFFVFVWIFEDRRSNEFEYLNRMSKFEKKMVHFQPKSHYH